MPLSLFAQNFDFVQCYISNILGEYLSIPLSRSILYNSNFKGNLLFYLINYLYITKQICRQYLLKKKIFKNNTNIYESL